MIQNSQKFSIRPMVVEDLKWVIQVGLNTPEFKTGTEATQFYGEETLDRWVNDSNGVTLVAEVDGQKAGFLLGYYMAGPNDGYINCLVVDQVFRRKGIGRILQASSLEVFSQKGIEGHKCDHVFFVVSETDEAMLNLSRQAGFEIGVKFRYVETMLPLKERT